MSHTITVEMECPECGVELSRDEEKCPKCGVELDWDIGTDKNAGDVDKMLNEIIKNSRSDEAIEVSPVGDEVETDEEVDEGEQDGKDPEEDRPDEEGTDGEENDEAQSPEIDDGSGSEHELDDEEGEVEDEDYEEYEDYGEEDLEEEPVEGEPKVEEPRRVYARTFSKIGIVTTVLAILSLVGLIVLFNYDVWVKGASEGSIGDTQMMAILAALLATIVLFAISATDAYRSRGRTKARS